MLRAGRLPPGSGDEPVAAAGDPPSSGPIMSTKTGFRAARAAEIDDLARLVAHSFPGDGRTHDWIAAQLREPLHGGGPETTLVAEHDGRAIGACQIHPFRQFIARVALPMAGVGTVAVSPTHRRRRLAAELVTAALHTARDRGDVVSALYPFRSAFYAKLGYGQADLAHQYQIAPDQLPDSPERLHVELLDDDAARRDALALYNRWARTQTGQLERGERVWREMWDGEDRALVGYRRAETRELEGYALALYRVDRAAKQRTLEIDEIVWSTNDARRGLYAWIASLADQWRDVLLRALPSHRLGDWIREPRLPLRSVPPWRLWAGGAALMYGTMFRIVDMAGAWERRQVDAGAALTVGLEIGDAQIEANHGVWRVELDGGRVAITRGAHAAVTLRTDIATLSRIFIGALAPSAGYEAGRLECDRPERLAALDAALVLPEPWTFDRF
jgi:predicted acetyltransferase